MGERADLGIRVGGGGGSGLATFKGGEQSIELPQGSTYTLPIQVSNAIIDRALDFRVNFGIWGTTTLAREGDSGSAVIDFSVVRLDHTFIPETRSPHETALSTTLSVACLLYTSPSPRDRQKSRMPSSA